MLASRLGSLTTVLTWLRSRACAGMQGLALLALVVVAPSGSVQGITWNCEHCCPYVASRLKSLLRVPCFVLPSQKYDTSCEICSVPGARAPTTYPPGTEALGPPRPCPSCGTASPSKPELFWNCQSKLPPPTLRWNQGPTPRPPGQLRWVPPPKRQKYDTRCEICSIPFQPFPDPFPGIKALGLPPRPPCQLRWVPPPHPTGHPSKNAIFLETKNTTHVAKFAPSLGPVPLPPTPEPKALDPCPAAKPTLP